MNHSLYRQMLKAGAAAGLLLAAGCAGTDDGASRQQAVPPPTVTSVASPVASPAGPRAETAQLNVRRDLLRVNVAAEGAADDGNALGRGIARRLQGKLCAGDARIVDGGDFDIRITIRPKFAVVGQDGDYVRLNGEVDVEIRDREGKRIFGVEKLAVASSQRTLGKEDAVSAFEASAAEATAKWCRNELRRIADAELSAAILSIRFPDKDRLPDPGSIKSIRDRIAGMPHIAICEFLGLDRQTGICQYRVVYFASAYPGGMANEVGALINSLNQN